MIREKHVSELVAIIKAFYENELGPLRIGLHPICFCPNNPECIHSGHGPNTIPCLPDNKVEIHINSSVYPDWYPSQIVYQLAHELWHAYEFSRFGITYSWQKYEKETEPYAHAASLCVLAQNLIPEKFLAKKFQIDYFNTTKFKPTERKIYDPGIKIAADARYDLKKLMKAYEIKVVPLILPRKKED